MRYRRAAIIIYPLAGLAWAGAVVLLVTQLAGDTTPPLATFAAAIATALTVIAAQLWTVRRAQAVVVTEAAARSDAYFMAGADIFESLLERREDDLETR